MCAEQWPFELSHCHAHSYIYIDTLIYICVHSCIQTHVFIYIYAYTYILAHTYLHLHTCINVFKPYAALLLTPSTIAHLFHVAYSLCPNMHRNSLMSDVLQCMRICCLKMP